MGLSPINHTALNQGYRKRSRAYQQETERRENGGDDVKIIELNGVLKSGRHNTLIHCHLPNLAEISIL